LTSSSAFGYSSLRGY